MPRVAKVENQVWLDSQAYGVLAMAGGHADHWKFADSKYCKLPRPVPYSELSENPRGYSIVDHQSKVITLAPSSVSRPELNYVPCTVEKHYATKFAGYEIHSKGYKEVANDLDDGERYEHEPHLADENL